MADKIDISNYNYTAIEADPQADKPINQTDSAVTTPNKSVLELAHGYYGAGLSSIPIRPDGSKAPASEWKPYQETAPTSDEIENWFVGLYQDHGIGIVAGRASGNLEVLDFDDRLAYEAWQTLLADVEPRLLNKLVLVETPSGGMHAYYRCDVIAGNQKLAQRKTDSGIKTLIETRGQGGYVVAPGSPAACHPSGELYRFVQGDAQTIPTITAGKRELLLRTAKALTEYVPPERHQDVHSQPNGTGERPGDDYNQQATWDDILKPARWTPVLTRGGMTFWRRPGKADGSWSATTNYQGSDLLYVFSSNAAPFEPGHAYDKFGAYTHLNHDGDFSAAARALAEQGYGPDDDDEPPHDLPASRRGCQATLLVDLASDVELFHTSDMSAYATIPVEGHREHWSLKSSHFRRFLARRFYEQMRAAPNTQAINDALGVLEGRAQYEGTEHQVFIRVAGHGGNIYLDLANAQWEAVEMTPDGWRLLQDPPVKFRRPRGMALLLHPIPGGTIEELRQFVNLDSAEQWILLVAWLVKALRPQGPYPIVALHGEQGSAKSTTTRLVRTLIDPNDAPLRAGPRSERDLMIAATNAWCLAFDNLSSLSPWLSDALCRLATGGGFSTRQLYSDDDEVLIKATRPVLLNGIEELTLRSDLLDRSILLALPTIAPGKRRDEAQFWHDFEIARPRILGALLDAVCTALRNVSDVALPQLPRMADFAKWSCAVAPACSWRLETDNGALTGADAFLHAYTRNQEIGHDLALEASEVAQAVQRLAARGDWEGTAGELLDLLTRECDWRETRQYTWPKNPQALANQLRRLAPNLHAVGIALTFWRKNGGHRHRMIAIRLMDEACDDSDTNGEDQ